MMHNVKLDFIPKPLDVGVRHGDQDVVPPRGPFDVIVLLSRQVKHFKKSSQTHRYSFIFVTYRYSYDSLMAYLKSDRVGVNY